MALIAILILMQESPWWWLCSDRYNPPLLHPLLPAPNKPYGYHVYFYRLCSDLRCVHDSRVDYPLPNPYLRINPLAPITTFAFMSHGQTKIELIAGLSVRHSVCSRHTSTNNRNRTSKKNSLISHSMKIKLSTAFLLDTLAPIIVPKQDK